MRIGEEPSSRSVRQPIEERARDERRPVVREIGSAQKHRRRARRRQRRQDRHVVHVERMERPCVAADRDARPPRPRAGFVPPSLFVPPGPPPPAPPAPAQPIVPALPAPPVVPAPPFMPAAPLRHPRCARRPRVPPWPPPSGPPVPAFERQPCARIKSPARDNRTSRGRDRVGPHMNVGEAVARKMLVDSRPGPHRSSTKAPSSL